MPPAAVLYPAAVNSDGSGFYAIFFPEPLFLHSYCHFPRLPVRYIKFPFPLFFINLVANEYFIELIIKHNNNTTFFYFSRTFTGNMYRQHANTTRDKEKHNEQTRHLTCVANA